MAPREALQAAMLKPRESARRDRVVGTMAAGKLVLFDANPLESIWNTPKIRAVLANGHYYLTSGRRAE